jgi:pimeloyl-ACP methyl ester carboxylesterase
MDLRGREVLVHTGGVQPAAGAPAVVLVHGAGMDHSGWRYQTRALALGGFAALAPDLPGHGRSAGPPLPSVEAMAAWLLDLLDAAGVASVSLVGHSMGSLVALEAAASAPTRVRRLALVGASGAMEVHPELQAAADRGDHLAVDLMVGWMHTGSRRLGGHPDPGRWIRGVTARLLERGLPVLAGDLRACSAYPGLERAASVRCPTLILLGAADLMTPPAAARALGDAIPGAALEVVAGAGHMVATEHPDETRRALEGFLRA